MVTIRVVGSPATIVAEPGKTLLECLRAAGVPISTSCGARAGCGLCRVTVVRGGDLIGPVSALEINHLGSVAKVVPLRLACQSTIERDGEIEIEVPTPVDVAARKLEKARRSRPGRAARDEPARGGAPSGASPAQGTGEHAQRQTGRIEWRPRKISAGGRGDGRT
jgi:ferredoxin, 2Fe-2S